MKDKLDAAADLCPCIAMPLEEDNSDESKALWKWLVPIIIYALGVWIVTINLRQYGLGHIGFLELRYFSVGIVFLAIFTATAGPVGRLLFVLIKILWVTGRGIWRVASYYLGSRVQVPPAQPTAPGAQPVRQAQAAPAPVTQPALQAQSAPAHRQSPLRISWDLFKEIYSDMFKASLSEMLHKFVALLIALTVTLLVPGGIKQLSDLITGRQLSDLITGRISAGVHRVALSSIWHIFTKAFRYFVDHSLWPWVIACGFIGCLFFVFRPRYESAKGRQKWYWLSSCGVALFLLSIFYIQELYPLFAPPFGGQLEEVQIVFSEETAGIAKEVLPLVGSSSVCRRIKLIDESEKSLFLLVDENLVVEVAKEAVQFVIPRPVCTERAKS